MKDNPLLSKLICNTIQVHYKLFARKNRSNTNADLSQIFYLSKKKKKVGELKNRLKDRGRESGISAAGQSHYIIQR